MGLIIRTAGQGIRGCMLGGGAILDCEVEGRQQLSPTGVPSIMKGVVVEVLKVFVISVD